MRILVKSLIIYSGNIFDACSDLIKVRMKGFFTRTFYTILANISINNLDNLDLDDLELYPSCILGLLLESPLIIFGRYRGDFPSTIQLKGVLADMSNLSIELKIQEAKGIPPDKGVQEKGSHDQTKNQSSRLMC
ncbi:uncharacterized protein LOC141711028 [Apium graveolens]|uniref:uncharacterized protein LOC141711028 n=1 Tax=Apium graveolens TaxID=4045 RepID=UPI003D7905FC